MTFFHKIPRNLQGRDFVAGDIHGTFDVLTKALQAVQFDPKVDRLFLVGDLIDRGRYSLASLAFLEQPWVYAVRGNHEQMFIELFYVGQPDKDLWAWHIQRNGMGWTKELTPAQREALLRKFLSLPYVMEIDTGRGRVGLLHAEVPIGMNWHEFTERISLGDDKVIQSAIWGRSRAERNCTDGVRGIDRVFVGHTPQSQGVRQLGNVFIADTAAVFAELGDGPGRLTLADMACATQVLIEPRKQPAIVFDIRDTPSSTPFSHYAK